MPPATQAQTQRFSLVLQDVPLDEALQQFSRITGIGLTYYPDLVAGRRTSCIAKQEHAEKVLRCIIKNTGLDFYRLPSSAYLITGTTTRTEARGWVSGVVLDRKTNLPLPHASVFLPEVSTGTSTNEAGFFALPPLPADTYVLIVSYIGYQSRQDTLHLTAGEAVQMRIKLEPAALFMEPIIVDGLQQRSPSRGLGANTVDLPVLANHVRGLGTPDVMLNTATLPSVHFNEATGTLHIQEGAAGEHQLRLDGSPIFITPHLAGLVGPFSPFALRRLTVHKAGFGASYGSQLSGMMLAEHRLRSAAGTNAEVQIDPLSLNAHGNLSSGKDGRITAMTTIRTSLEGLYRAPTLQKFLQASGTPDLFIIHAPLVLFPGAALPVSDLTPPQDVRFHFTDLHAAAQLEPGALQRLGASFYRGSNRLEGFHYAEPDSFEIDDANTWINEAGHVRFESVLGSQTIISLLLRSSRYSFRHDYDLVNGLFATYGDIFSASQLIQAPVQDANNVHEHALEANIEIAAHTRHYVEAGLEVMRTASRFDFTAANTLSLLDQSLSNAEDTLLISRRSIAHRHRSFRVAAYVQDRILLSRRLTLEPGLRITWLPNTKQLLPEPRLSLRYERAFANDGVWAIRLAMGRYHQFLNQFDLTTANLGALLPSLRFWMPVDATIRPPKAYHGAAEMLLNYAGWTVRADAFVKYASTLLTLSNRSPTSAFLNNPPTLLTQAEFLEKGRGHAYGLALSLDKALSRGRVETRAVWSEARRRFPSRFENRYLPGPWNEPLRLEAGIQMRLRPWATILLRGTAIWGRTYGFRQAYYDYLASDVRTQHFAGYDLSRPEQHRLPPVYQVDLAVVLQPIRDPVGVQLRGDLINVLNRDNVGEWHLPYDSTLGDFTVVPRLMVPFTPVASVRLSW